MRSPSRHPLRRLFFLLAALNGVATTRATIFQDSGQELTAVGGNWSRAVALGDVDGDGDVDAVVAQGAGGVPQENLLWLNDGLARFSQGPDSLGAGDSRDVALGDLDGDGDLDVWIANTGIGGTVRDTLWINQGGAQGGVAGVFRAGGEIETAGSDRVALADLDQDGDVDALTAGTHLRAWLNDGAATFVPMVVSFGASGASQLVLADLDQDGDADVVASGDGTFVPIQVVWNRLPEGMGFVEGPTLQTEANLNSLVAARFDEDPLPDVFLDTDLGAFLWINLGDGTFRVDPIGSVSHASSATAGDLDQNGEIDVFITRRTVFQNGADGFWLNRSGGHLSLSAETLGTYDGFGAALADLNGDGTLDVFVANSGPNKVWLNVSRPPGTPGELSNSGQSLGIDDTADVALGDLDGDGDLDAVTVGGDGNRVSPDDDPNRVWINQGGSQGGVPGVFKPTEQRLGSSSGRAVALSDVDRDGDLDIFLAAFAGSSIWINQGGAGGGEPATFVRLDSTLGRDFPTAAALEDIDADADPDAVAADHFSEPQIFLNLGGAQAGSIGEFSTNAIQIAPRMGISDVSDFLVKDLDHDGRLDILTVQSDRLNLWTNAAAIDLPWAQTVFRAPDDGTLEITSVASADFDGDGDDDLFLGGYSEHRVALNSGGLQGGQAGQFQISEVRHVARRSKRVKMGDLDGNGRSDSVVISDAQVEILMGEGGDRFHLTQTLTGLGINSGALGDLDGDGDLDLWIARSGPDYIWLNGEYNLDPVLTYHPAPRRDASGESSLDQWDPGNARLLLRLSRTNDIPVVMEATASAEFTTDLFEPKRISSVEQVTILPGETVVALQTFTNQPGGNAGEIWNPYLGLETIPTDEFSYEVLLRILTPGISLLGPARIQLTFHQPEFGIRRCFLEGMLLLLRLVGGGGPSLHAVTAPSPAFDLTPFRRFRDETLKSTPQGRYLVDLYERMSPLALQTMSERPWMLWRAYDVLTEWTPAIRAVVDRKAGEAEITPSMSLSAQRFLNELQEGAPAELGDAILRESTALEIESWLGLSMASLMERVETRMTVPVWATRLEMDPAAPTSGLR